MARARFFPYYLILTIFSNLIAWANDHGVKIFDTVSEKRITYIDRPAGSPRPDLYRCCLCWENDRTLIIGWADSVKVCVVKERVDTSDNLPSLCVEISFKYVSVYTVS